MTTTDLSLEQYRKLVRRGKRSKYGNKRTEIDGQSFDSKKEARRAQELRLLAASGAISHLDFQRVFKLIVNEHHICKYIADFCYYDNATGEYIVEDVKSEITKKNAVYVMKKKLMRAIHGIEIRET